MDSSAFMSMENAEEQKIRISKTNVDTAVHFGEAIGGLIGVFVLLHFGRLLSPRCGPQLAAATKVCALPIRFARRWLNRKAPKFPSLGHALTMVTYVAINIVLAFTNGPGLPFSSSRNWFQKRLGWMAVLNLCATVLLSVKNTPLAFLTGYSYERLFVFHRAVGCCTIVCSILHWSTYIGVLVKSNQALPLLFQTSIIHGEVAAAGLLILGFVSLPIIRRNFYEVFLKIHTICYLLIFVNVGMHQPFAAKKMIWVVVFFGSVYALSRMTRAAMMAWNSFENTATLIPLDGATKVVLRKRIAASPGSHAFLTIPAVRPLESHPFSISDVGDTQFRVRRMGGFTAALHNYAKRHPGARVSVLIEGPFGRVPDFKSYDRVLLIAGGVGATHAISIALEIARAPDRPGNKHVEFVWVVQQGSHIAWFNDELDELQASSNVELSIYVTRSREQSSAPALEAKVSRASGHNVVHQREQREKQGLPAPRLWTGAMSVMEGRPDIPGLINTMMKTAKKADHIVVSACGPASLMDCVRSTVAGNISVSGPSITLANQQFGW